MTSVKRHKIKLREVNRHLVCRLCRGYYVDATTIAECLHSFCRSCIIKYLEKNSFCPICEVQIHKTKPYLNLRLDKALQDVVYKLVPGLYHNEMARRRKFFGDKPDIVTTPEQRGVEERLIFSPEDSISLSLEFMESPEPEPESLSSHSSENGEDFPLQLGLMKVRRGDSSARKESTDSNEPGEYPKRFLLCPAVVSIRLLKKFLTMKFELSSSMEVEIMHKRVSLPDHYTLMDIAYIFTWKRMAPMRLFYQICKVKNEKPADTLIMESRRSTKPEAVTVIPEPIEIKPAPPIIVKSEKPSPVVIKVEEHPVAVSNENKDTGNILKPPKTIADSKKEVKTVEKEVVEKREVKEGKKVVPKIETGNKTDHKMPSPALILKSNVEKNGTVIPKQVQKAVKDIKDMESPISLKKVPEVKSPPSSSQKPKASPENQIPKVASELKGPNLKCPPVAKVEGGKLLVPPPKVSLHVSQTKTVPPKNGELKVQPKACDQQSNQHPGKSVEGNGSALQPKPTQNQKIIPNVAKHVLPVGVVKKAPEFKKESPASGSSEKLLLNPISGKLEPVSASPEKAKPEGKAIKSSVQQLKTFRKDKALGKANSLTITTTPSNEKVVPKEEANVSIEIKTDGRGSEYDFESSSPPNRIMSLQEYTQSELYKSKYSKMNGSPMNLQDFRKQVLNGNGVVDHSEDGKKDKNKMPLLYRINNDKKVSPKIAKAKEDSMRVINIKTPEHKPGNSPPKPIKIENKDGEYSIKPSGEGSKTPKRDPDSEVNAELLRLLLKRRDAAKSKAENANGKRPKTPVSSPMPIKPPTPIDLSKTDPATPTPSKIPLENLMELAKKPMDQKKDQNMLEMLISIAQKQSIEPLLKVPQYPQGSRSGTPSQTVSPNDITQALQFFQKLSSDMKMLEARAQTEQSLPPRPPNILTLQQYYLQQIEFVRMLKRQQAMGGEVATKIPKMSPTKDDKKSSSDKDEATLKNVERTISQIQEQAEIQRRIVAAQNCKNLPALLQYYSHPGSPLFRPNLSPPGPGQSPPKNSQLSPNSQKSPPSFTPEEQQQLLASQQQMFSAGLTSEMSFHQMFQQYLAQQLKMNQRKLPGGKRSASPPSKCESPPEKKSPTHLVQSSSPHNPDSSIEVPQSSQANQQPTTQLATT